MNLLDALLKIFDRPKLIQPGSSQSNENLVISIFCKAEDVKHLDSLTRYYESDYTGIISRGLWLLTTMRNAEINSRKLAIVEIDEEAGQVLQITPIVLM